MNEDNIIDAKFKVIRPKRRWRWSFNWRGALVVGALSVPSFVRSFLQHH